MASSRCVSSFGSRARRRTSSRAATVGQAVDGAHGGVDDRPGRRPRARPAATGSAASSPMSGRSADQPHPRLRVLLAGQPRPDQPRTARRGSRSSCSSATTVFSASARSDVVAAAQQRRRAPAATSEGVPMTRSALSACARTAGDGSRERAADRRLRQRRCGGRPRPAAARHATSSGGCVRPSIARIASSTARPFSMPSARARPRPAPAPCRRLPPARRGTARPTRRRRTRAPCSAAMRTAGDVLRAASRTAGRTRSPG